MLRTLLYSALLAASTAALNTIEVRNQEFVDSKTGNRFDIVGIDYQPGGESGYNPSSGEDPLTDGDTCLRDAALLQQLGVNTIRVYNLNATSNHDLCASIFNSVGIYMILDVNTPFLSIVNTDPAKSYTNDYLTQIFGLVEAFRGYDNTLGFFSANELVNDDTTAGPNPPYIRAVTRDLKQYIKARGGRQVPVGYSAAQIQDILVDTSNYVQCATNGDASDMARSDFFGLNDYQWCGDSSLQMSGYDQLASWYGNTSIPVFFSEYGCNKVLPRQFTEIPALYSPQMSVLSGGLIYQWTQDESNFGIVQINNNGTTSLLRDYDTIKSQYAKLDNSFLTRTNNSATAVKPPTCGPSLISGSSFNSSFVLPNQPSNAQSMIKNGVQGVTVGKMVSVTNNNVKSTVYNTAGQPMANLAIKQIPGANTPSTTSSSGSSSSSSGAANAALRPGEMGVLLSGFVTILAVFGLY